MDVDNRMAVHKVVPVVHVPNPLSTAAPASGRIAFPRRQNHIGRGPHRGGNSAVTVSCFEQDCHPSNSSNGCVQGSHWRTESPHVWIHISVSCPCEIILFLNILILLECTQSADNVFHLFTVLWEKRTSNLPPLVNDASFLEEGWIHNNVMRLT